MFRHINQFTALGILLGCLTAPLTGCGASSTPVGVEDDGLEEALEEQQSKEYISGEEQY